MLNPRILWWNTAKSICTLVPEGAATHSACLLFACSAGCKHAAKLKPCSSHSLPSDPLPPNWGWALLPCVMPGWPEMGPRGTLFVQNMQSKRVKWTQGRGELGGAALAAGMGTWRWKKPTSGTQSGAVTNPNLAFLQPSSENVFCWWGSLLMKACGGLKCADCWEEACITSHTWCWKTTSNPIPPILKNIKSIAHLKQTFPVKGKLHSQALWCWQACTAWEERRSFSWVSPLVSKNKAQELGPEYNWYQRNVFYLENIFFYCFIGFSLTSAIKK